MIRLLRRLGGTIAALLIFTACTGAPSEAEPEATPVPQPPPIAKHIIHAAGDIDGYLCTNSLEALENAYANGNRMIEMDFNYTSDGYPVCIHDWNYNLYPPYQKGICPTREEYLQERIYHQFTPLWLGSLAEYLTQHPDLYIVTDVKDKNIEFAQTICRDYPQIMHQFVIQIYSEEQYPRIRELGFDHIIFTVYNLPWDIKTDPDYLVSFARSNPLFAYTFPWELCEIEGYTDTLLTADVPLYVHTVNDPDEQRRFFDMGISGVYTDNTIHTIP